MPIAPTWKTAADADADADAAGAYTECSHHNRGLVMDGSAQVNCTLVGDGAVGKTSMWWTLSSVYDPQYDKRPFTYDPSSTELTYVPEYPPSNAACEFFVEVNGRTVHVTVTDEAGGHEAARLRPLVYARTDVFVVAYSVDSRDSFEAVLQKWLPELKWAALDRRIPILLVATKCDLRLEAGLAEKMPSLARRSKRFARAAACITTDEGSELARKVRTLESWIRRPLDVPLRVPSTDRDARLRRSALSNSSRRRRSRGWGTQSSRRRSAGRTASAQQRTATAVVAARRPGASRAAGSARGSRSTSGRAASPSSAQRTQGSMSVRGA